MQVSQGRTMSCIWTSMTECATQRALAMKLQNTVPACGSVIQGTKAGVMLGAGALADH